MNHYVAWLIPLLVLHLLPGADACAEQPAYELIDVPFLTNREASVNRKGEPRYSADPAKETTDGRCRLRVYELPDAEVVVERYEPVPAGEAIGSLEPGADERVTLYVHGYNIGLERACRDAAVLARRTGFEGRTLLFSWPASRTVVTYHKDAGRFAESVPYIFAALDELGQRFGRGNVNIVAHSMGSRLVRDAVNLIDVSKGRFGELVLIAPDVDREAFVAALPDIERIVEDVTVLVSDDDRLLLLSQTVNLGARLGQASGTDIDGVDVIDVTGVNDAGLGGHLYHLTNEAVGEVIGAILEGDLVNDTDVSALD
jgi:esterase/lipase superfamily enzyme